MAAGSGRTLSIRYGGIPPPSIAGVATDLLPVASSREVPHSHGRPPQLPHYGRQAAASPRRAATLWDLEDIQEHLAAHAF